MRLWLGPILLSACAISSCATVQSSVKDGRSGATEIAEGLAYSVPIQLVRINLNRTIETVTNVDDLAAEYYEARQLASAQEKEIRGLKLALSHLDRLHELANEDGSNITAEQRGKIEEARINARVILEHAEAEWTSRKKKRDAALEVLQAATAEDPKKVEWKRKRPVDKISITALPYSADPRFEFVAKFPHSIFRSEDHGISTNEKGLLQSVDIKSEDGTKDLLVAVASLAGLAGSGVTVPTAFSLDAAYFTDADFSEALNKWNTKLFGLEGESVDELLRQILLVLKEYQPAPRPDPVQDCSNLHDQTFADEASRQQTGPFSYVFTFDPLNKDYVAQFNKQACRLNSNLRLRVYSGGGSTSASSTPVQELHTSGSSMQAPVLKSGSTSASSIPVSDALPSDSSGYNHDQTDGIVYRQLRPVLQNVTEIVKTPGGHLEEVPIDSVLLDMPNGAPLRRVTDFGSAFSKRSSNLKFNDGMLVDYRFTRPSEIGQAGNALVEVAKAPFRAVAEVVKINVDTAEGQKKIAESTLAIEKLRLEQELALIEKSDATKTKLSENALKRSETEQKLNDLVLEADIAALTRDDAVSSAELDEAIKLLKKRKEFLLLQKELADLESRGE